jgi:hypothetical protein
MIGKLLSPTFYTGQYNKVASSLEGYYRPMIRAGR